ncbi:carbohydrate kinase [Alkalicoccus daliensis]|uniref:Pseudouridine kinase n=1 Tax=Alkalicoccus daliensis TaxID=745820 RepID=A0A1H0IBU1_9BACI|nr:carbohydrate kinase [Alkalicoccus daliensis]SDO28897.1 pseudouridine kinase [Alkalicoccus daliensis]
MLKKEKILALIKQNPYISQQEIASELKLSRSAAAGYISSLMKEGKILGKAYILKEEPAVCCIGGANIDRKLRTENFQWGDSNPVSGSETIGGVARNLAVNLQTIGVPSALFTVVGEDSEGKEVLSQQEIDLSLIQKLPQHKTGTYTAVLNEKSEMIFALAEMNIYDEFTPELLKNQWNRLTSYQILAVDTNIPLLSLEWLLENKNSHQKIVVVPVSAAKINRIPYDLRGIDLLILNKLEASVLASRYEAEENTIEETAEILFRQGAANIVITAGENGVYVKSARAGFKKPPPANVVDVTGAGDAFASILIHALLNEEDLLEYVENAFQRAKATIESEETVIKTKEGIKL